MYPYNTPPRTNKLLEHLRQIDRELTDMSTMEVVSGQIISMPGSEITHAYFPIGCYVSLISLVEGGETEVSLAGDEGMVGYELAMSATEGDVKAVVQGPGSMISIPAASFMRQLDRSAPLRAAAGRYAHYVLTEYAQVAGCNRFHVVKQRLARWLLMSADRAHSPNFETTQEFMAAMLGVRRVSITNAASELQNEGVLSYERGRIRILDRKGLERAACRCYKDNLKAYNRIFAQGPSSSNAEAGSASQRIGASRE